MILMRNTLCQHIQFRGWFCCYSLPISLAYASFPEIGIVCREDGIEINNIKEEMNLNLEVPLSIYPQLNLNFVHFVLSVSVVEVSLHMQTHIQRVEDPLLNTIKRNQGRKGWWCLVRDGPLPAS